MWKKKHRNKGKAKKKESGMKVSVWSCDALSAQGLPAQANGSRGLFIFKKLDCKLDKKACGLREREPPAPLSGALRKITRQTPSVHMDLCMCDAANYLLSEQKLSWAIVVTLKQSLTA